MIVYPTGSGGSFLTRLLSLSEKTIPMMRHEDYLVDQTQVTMTAQQRFDLYNHFNVTDWQSGECAIIHQYSWGYNDFYKYIQSSRFLVDSRHPQTFLKEDQSKVLWMWDTWKNMIFVNCDEEDRKFLARVSNRKNYFPQDSEPYRIHDQLQEQYQHKSITLDFKDLLNWQRFEPRLKHIDQVLTLDLDFELAQQLWSNWYSKSQECWYGSIKFDHKSIYGVPWAPKKPNPHNKK
jgi:hypothetical protein